MKLNKGTIRPGTVLQVLENGMIKASAPGLFSFTDDPEKMPPIMPWFIGSNSNSFSKLKQYDEVWILNFTDNPRQLYWFRKDNNIDNNELLIPETENRVVDEENVEIICNRDAKGEWATIYFSDGSGWVIGKGDSIIQIREDGTILLSTGLPNRCIDINGKNISIGSKDESEHPAAYGDEVANVLFELCKLLQQVAIAAIPNPYTSAIGTKLLTGLPNVTGKIPNVSSTHVTID
jgi:hypothetical protein